VHVSVEGDVRAPELGPEWTMVTRDPETGLHESASGLGYCVATFRRT
jgi:hypothetical protein